MTEISLKGLEGPALQSAMKKYNDLGAYWTTEMAKSDGKPNWEQQLEMQKRKDDLLTDIDAYNARNKALLEASNNVMWKSDATLDREASVAKLEEIRNNPDAKAGLNALLSNSYIVRKNVPFAASEEFNKYKELEPQKTANVNGNYRFDEKGQTDAALEAWERPSVQERVKATGITKEEYVKQTVDYARRQVQDHVDYPRYKPDSGGSGDGGTKVGKVTIFPQGSFSGSDTNVGHTYTTAKTKDGKFEKTKTDTGVTSFDYEYTNGFKVKAPTDGTQIDARKLMAQNSSDGTLKVSGEDTPLTGNQKVVVNDANVGYVMYNSGNAVVINGTKYGKGAKIKKDDVEEFKKKSNFYDYRLMINTTLSGNGAQPVEIWASSLSEMERKEFGITSQYPTILSKEGYNKMVGNANPNEKSSATTTKKPNQFGI